VGARALIAVILVLSACKKAEQAPAPPPPAAPVAIKVTPAQFRSLAWLEGRWIGTQAGGSHFYEGYRFADDSTLRSYEYGDSTAAPAKDSGRIWLSGDTVLTGSGNSRYVLTALDSGSAHFAPLVNARNAFTWRRNADSSWTATLAWRDSTGAERTRVYEMRRSRAR
jgi:hypothetical protein